MASFARSGLLAAALVVPFVVMDRAGDTDPPAAAGINGPARALDGDTLEIGVVRIRIHGIDAPEFDQTCARADGAAWPCGRVAAARLAELVAGGSIACTPRERDHFGRIVATCHSGGRDVAAAMAREGLAWAYLRFSDAYADGEAAARARGLGIWQGAAQAAWDYRASADFRPAAGTAPRPECAIKGNVSGAGERIYHLPGTAAYGRTRVSEAAGEAWFCSEDEARAAGWRPPKGR